MKSETGMAKESLLGYFCKLNLKQAGYVEKLACHISNSRRRLLPCAAIYFSSSSVDVAFDGRSTRRMSKTLQRVQNDAGKFRPTNLSWKRRKTERCRDVVKQALWQSGSFGKLTQAASVKAIEVC